MHHILFAILLLEGFITISVEILTMRQLLPFFGGSVVITSIIISVFLLFLAIGYWRGGCYKENYLQKLHNNFIASLFWIGIGLSYLFISVFLEIMVLKIGLSFLLSLTVYLLLILAPIVYWLGQTVPLTTNLFNQQRTVSHISGSALFLSTVGSFLGALLTSLVLFQFLGVAWTVVINCALLFLLILYLQIKTQIQAFALLILCLGLCTILAINVNVESYSFIKTNNYGNYQVKNLDIESKILEINLSSSSLLTAKKEGFAYIEFIRNLLSQLKLQNKQILVIGAGGFSLTAAGTDNNHFTFVDIDPAIKEIAEQHFLNQRIQGEFVGADARFYLNTTKQLFDVIISDAYSNIISIPPSLLTIDYFKQLGVHLKPSGLLIINIIADPLFRDDYSRRVDNTIRQAFPFCTISPISWKPESNLIYVCVNQPEDKQFYSDNLTSATFDFFRKDK